MPGWYTCNTTDIYTKIKHLSGDVPNSSCVVGFAVGNVDLGCKTVKIGTNPRMGPRPQVDVNLCFTMYNVDISNYFALCTNVPVFTSGRGICYGGGVGAGCSVTYASLNYGNSNVVNINLVGAGGGGGGANGSMMYYYVGEGGGGGGGGTVLGLSVNIPNGASLNIGGSGSGGVYTYDSGSGDGGGGGNTSVTLGSSTSDPTYINILACGGGHGGGGIRNNGSPNSDGSAGSSGGGSVVYTTSAVTDIHGNAYCIQLGGAGGRGCTYTHSASNSTNTGNSIYLFDYYGYCCLASPLVNGCAVVASTSVNGGPGGPSSLCSGGREGYGDGILGYSNVAGCPGSSGSGGGGSMWIYQCPGGVGGRGVIVIGW